VDPVYIFSSEHPLLVDRAVAEIRDKAVPPAMRGWNYDVVEGKATASRIIGAANTLPMMGERRMVLVRDLAAMAADELGKLVAYLDAPSPSTVLVAITSKLDKRMKVYATAAKKGWLHVLEAPRNPQPWIRDEAKARGVKIDGGAISRLADAIGSDLSRLALTLDQLALYAGGRAISVDDVEDLVAETRERSVFELTDAIGEGRLPAALAAVSSLCDQRQSAIGVIAMLARHIRQLATIHAGKPVGAPPFIVEKLTVQARRYRPQALAAADAMLFDVDRALKGQPLDEWVSGTVVKTLGRQLSERVILERLVEKLCALAA
jgi:DNA polymerase-3 subunit delta